MNGQEDVQKTGRRRPLVVSQDATGGCTEADGGGKDSRQEGRGEKNGGPEIEDCQDEDRRTGRRLADVTAGDEEDPCVEAACGARKAVANRLGGDSRAWRRGRRRRGGRRQASPDVWPPR